MKKYINFGYTINQELGYVKRDFGEKSMISRLSSHKEPIMAMATINPRLCLQRSIRIEVVQGGEGPNPHVHVYLSDGSVAYISLTEPKYAKHHDTQSAILNRKEKEEFIEIMITIWKKQFIEVFKLDENGNRLPEVYTRYATGYEAAVSIWTDTYGGEDLFTYNNDGSPIMPDYSQL